MNLWSFLKNINDTTDNMVKLRETADKTLIYVTKVTGVYTGAAGSAKRTVNMLKAVACHNGICAVISGIGVCADGISIATSFITGPNITTIITVTIYAGCKVLVYCCKKAKNMPWGC